MPGWYDRSTGVKRFDFYPDDDGIEVLIQYIRAAQQLDHQFLIVFDPGDIEPGNPWMHLYVYDSHPEGVEELVYALDSTMMPHEAIDRYGARLTRQLQERQTEESEDS